MTIAPEFLSLWRFIKNVSIKENTLSFMDKMENRKWILSTLFLGLFLLHSEVIHAEGLTGSTALNYALIFLAGILTLLAAVTLADNLFQINRSTPNTDKSTFAIFPNFSEFGGSRMPDYAIGDSAITLKKGFDLNIVGAPSSDVVPARVSRYAVQPTNYRGIAPIPKVVVEAGDEVKAGDVLFYDKRQPEIKFVAPVSGEVVAVNRGEKRAISEVVILADKDIKYRNIPTFNLADASREDIVGHIKATGVWPSFIQRPYDTLAQDIVPENIFVSTFDTSPLAPDLSKAIIGKEAAFQMGLDVMSRLTSGDVHLGLDGRPGHKPADGYTQAAGVKKHWFNGAHPSGNVGIQIHHIASIGRGQKIWTIRVEDVITLGSIFLYGKYDASRIIAVTGSAISHPVHMRTYVGAQIGELLNNQVIQDNSRIISGTALTGSIKTKDQYMNVGDRQITVLPEGDSNRMFGWLLPTSTSPSLSRTYPTNHLFKNLTFNPTTNTNGEERGYVVTGEYEQVLPMDLYPQHLIKAIKANDYEAMEGLGIYELSEEDVALCEYVCTSKIPVQSILRQGLEMMSDQE